MENSAYKIAGRHIKRLRQEKGWTQREVAEKIDITEGFLSFLESGTKQGSLDTYIALCRLFQYPLWKLLKGGQEPDRSRPRTLALNGLSRHQVKVVQQVVREFRAGR